MRINWTARLRNRWWWMTIIPAVLLLVQQVAGLFGVSLDVAQVQGQLLAIVGTVLGVLVLLGVNIDMTTEGIGDSDRAMGYAKPYAPGDDEPVTGKHAEVPNAK